MPALFSKFGKVVTLRGCSGPRGGGSKGFGFVTFGDNSNDAQLVGKLGPILDDKQVCFLRIIICEVHAY